MGENGITQRTLRGEVFIPWREVIEYSKDSTLGFYEVKSANQTIRFSSLISDYHELKEEIARRSPSQAKRGWDFENRISTGSDSQNLPGFDVSAPNNSIGA